MNARVIDNKLWLLVRLLIKLSVRFELRCPENTKKCPFKNRIYDLKTRQNVVTKMLIAQ